MKETRVSGSENPVSSSCSAITQCFLHAGASPSYYVGISKIWKKWGFEFLRDREPSFAFLNPQCTQSLVENRHSTNVYWAGPRSYGEEQKDWRPTVFSDWSFLACVKADSFMSKDEDGERRALILWMLSGWKGQKKASISRSLPVRDVDLQIQGVVCGWWSPHLLD